MHERLTEEELNQQIFEQAEQFSLWQYNLISPFLEGKVIEIGPGNGRITKQIYENDKVTSITGIDTNRRYLKQLSRVFREFGKKPMVFSYLDLQLPLPSTFKEAFDSALAIDVLEHVKDDVEIIKNCHSLLKKNGRIILLVPAFRFLFGEPDRAQNHYRRYSRGEIMQKMRVSGFTIEKIFPMNFIGVLAWFYHSRILQLRIHRARDMNLFDKCVPLFQRIERIVPIPFGLSYIVIGKKE